MLLSPDDLSSMRKTVRLVAHDVSLAFRDEVDRDHRWPRESMEALAKAGLMGLHVPRALGGHGLGYEALLVACESLGRVCPSSALCFGMHSVGTAVIAAKATEYHEERYLRAIARGQHITTLALSEKGTGSHFYLPQLSVREGASFILQGEKTFVTNGGHADSYVVSTAAPSSAQDPGRFTCVVVDKDTPGIAWGPAWTGFGMRGNESRSMRLTESPVPRENLLGEVGDQIWYVFEVVAPYFLMAMSGTYLGLASAILDLTLEHLRTRAQSHSGESLADVPVLQHRVAEMWMAVESARQLAYNSARMADAGDPAALVSILSSKALIGDVVVDVANEAMTLGGGQAYMENSLLSRFLRDARAAHVMSPTTDLLKLWTGRALLGRPLL